MNLPQDKQERIKLFIVIGLAGTLTVLGIAQGIVAPLRRSRRLKSERLVELEQGLEAARREIRVAARQLQSNEDRIGEIKRISDRYVLKPVLGNYLLSATEIVEKHARSIGLVTQPVREMGISEIPKASGGAENTLKTYTARVMLDNGYHDALRLVREIENGNPYACITGLGVSGQPEVSPERHKIYFDIQWPIWADPAKASELEEQLKMNRGFEMELPDAHHNPIRDPKAAACGRNQIESASLEAGQLTAGRSGQRCVFASTPRSLIVLLSIVLLLPLATPALAQEPSPTNSMDEATANTNAPALKDSVLRDPFWPVGYWPTPPEVKEDKKKEALQKRAAKVAVQWPALTVKGISKVGGRYLAIVDGAGLVEAGQQVTVRHGNLMFTWEIEAIRAEGISYKKVRATPYPSGGGLVPRT